jgi:hypothetical protein
MMLRKEHFETIHAQMEHKEAGKLTINDTPELLSKHFRDIGTNVLTLYG